MDSSNSSNNNNSTTGGNPAGLTTATKTKTAAVLATANARDFDDCGGESHDDAIMPTSSAAVVEPYNTCNRQTKSSFVVKTTTTPQSTIDIERRQEEEVEEIGGVMTEKTVGSATPPAPAPPPPASTLALTTTPLEIVTSSSSSSNNSKTDINNRRHLRQAQRFDFSHFRRHLMEKSPFTFPTTSTSSSSSGKIFRPSNNSNDSGSQLLLLQPQQTSTNTINTDRSSRRHSLAAALAAAAAAASKSTANEKSTTRLSFSSYLPTSVCAKDHVPTLDELRNGNLPPLGNRGMSVYNDVSTAKSASPVSLSPTPNASAAPATTTIINAYEESNTSSKYFPKQHQLHSPTRKRLPHSHHHHHHHQQHRLLNQDTGRYNLMVTHIPHYQRRLMSDMWTTLVELPWRYVLILFLLSYFAVWTIFAAVYWLIAYSHDDLSFEHRNSSLACIRNVHSFTSAFLFSFESQHTIGYGYRHITEQCLEAIMLLCLQSVLGVAIQAFMIGLIFTRIQRPALHGSSRQSNTLLFSRHACICTRDGQLCLLFRVGNTRTKSLLIHSRISAHLVHHRKTLEGELLPLHQHELLVQLDSMCGGGGSSAQHNLAWPTTACHIISNEASPLFDMDRDAMTQQGRFELIVSLEGVIESTGQSIQASTSYLPSEIMWGYRFVPLLSYRKNVENTSALGRRLSLAAAMASSSDHHHHSIESVLVGGGRYAVDFKKFDDIEAVAGMLDCSAAQLKRLAVATISTAAVFAAECPNTAGVVSSPIVEVENEESPPTTIQEESQYCNGVDVAVCTT